MLKTHAYELIKQRLFELELVSGQFVTQKQISEMIGIPLGPVREAMQVLQTEGLVRILPQRGIEITQVTERMIRDLYGVRRLLELPGVRALAKHGDLSALKELRRTTRETLRREKQGEIDRLSGRAFRVEQSLHEMVIAALDNEVVRDIYKVQQDRLRLVRLNIRVSVEFEQGLVDHIGILDALCRRDVTVSVAQMLAHLNNAERRALAGLRQMPSARKLPGLNPSSAASAS